MSYKKNWKTYNLFLGLLILFGCQSRTEHKLVAVAASSFNAIEEIYSDVKNIDIIQGASGTLCSQLFNGAPYDLVITADKLYAQAIQDSLGLEIYETSSNPMQLWTKDLPTSLFNKERLRVAIANPDVAPFGAKALAYLKSTNTDKRHELVYGNNITQVNQYIAEGLVDAAITSNSSKTFLKNKEVKGIWSAIPDKNPLKQYAILINKEEKYLLDSLFTDRSTRILIQHGFSK